MLKKFLIYLLPFSILLYVLHWVAMYFVGANLFYPLYLIYLFLGLISLGMYALLLWISKNFPDKTGYAFMAMSLFKMFLAVLFLLPLLLDQERVPHLLLNIANFFIPYFLYLILETFFAVKLLRAK